MFQQHRSVKSKYHIMPGETPSKPSNQIGHYLNSRSSGSDTLTSNLTFTKPTVKSSTFASKDEKPVAKPRSVYSEANQENSRSSPPSYPLTTTNNLDTSTSYPIVTVGNGGEDWGTKKRVETKTVKTIGMQVAHISETKLYFYDSVLIQQSYIIY